MGGRDRHPSAPDTPTLGARALMRVIEELAVSEQLIEYRVAYKKNAKGEHVVALIYLVLPGALRAPMPVHTLDTSALSELAKPGSALACHRLVAEVDAGRIVVLLTWPLMWELVGGAPRSRRPHLTTRSWRCSTPLTSEFAARHRRRTPVGSARRPPHFACSTYPCGGPLGRQYGRLWPLVAGLERSSGRRSSRRLARRRPSAIKGRT
jgi:hypothetical protein